MQKRKEKDTPGLGGMRKRGNGFRPKCMRKKRPGGCLVKREDLGSGGVGLERGGCGYQAKTKIKTITEKTRN